MTSDDSCSDVTPHGRHEWYDPVFRRECDGVPGAPLPGFEDYELTRRIIDENS